SKTGKLPDSFSTDSTGSVSASGLVDLDYLEKKYKPKRMQELIHLFIDSSDNLIEKIATTIDNRDSQTLKASAHELAGSCLMLRMDGMLKEARHLEATAKSGDWSDAKESLKRLRENFAATKEIVLPVLK